MKRFLLSVVLLVGCSVFADDGWQVTGATEDSVVMAAPAARVNARFVDAWSAQTYEQGAYVKNTAGVVYWTPTGGASATEPDHAARAGTTGYDSEAIYWYRINNQARKSVIVYADITSTAYVLAGKQPTMGGDPLSAIVPAQVYKGEQGAIYLKGAGVYDVTVRM